MSSFLAPRKLIAEISGGLGNQMFQYAAARAFSLETGADLKLERRSGFVFDFRYRRKFELDKLETKFSNSSIQHSLLFYSNRLNSFVESRLNFRLLKSNKQRLISDLDFEFVDFSKIVVKSKNIRMSGYFQDPRYFEKYRAMILRELQAPTPTDVRILELGDLTSSYTLIALGIRMFEESSDPLFHAKDRRSKSVEDFQDVLTMMLSGVTNPLVLVFTTKEFDFLRLLNLPDNTIFVNANRGFENSIDKLWLMSKCQHHVFNNSTFYWWGAALSQINYDVSKQQIFCADNFLNPDISYPTWKKF